MWILYAFLSAFFAGGSTILAKIGIMNVESNVATALRTVVVILFAGLMVLVAGSQNTVADIGAKTWVFLILSGLATGASWLCFFKALQFADMNKVVPIDRTSTVLTMLLAFVLLGEDLSLVKILSMILISVGTYMMVAKARTETENPAAPKAGGGGRWLLYAVLSALTASMMAIFGKVGIVGVESNLGTAIRTAVLFVMAWGIVLFQKNLGEIKKIRRYDWVFILLSGLATGLSWLCYFRALQDGLASVVVPVDRLGILLIVAFGWLFLGEKFTKRSTTGLALLTAGTLAVLL